MGADVVVVRSAAVSATGAAEAIETIEPATITVAANVETRRILISLMSDLIQHVRH
jgi:hypothetical protein